MARRRFGDSRGRGAGLSDSAARDLYPRFGLDNAARAGSTESYNRRKPVLLSTGTPELAANAATTAKIATNAVTSVELASGPNNPDRAVDGNNIKTGVIGDAHINGRLSGTSLPPGVIIGNVQRSNIANNAVHPKDQVDWTVGVDDFIPVSKLASRPWPSVASVKAKTAPPDVVQLIRKHVKPASLK